MGSVVHDPLTLTTTPPPSVAVRFTATGLAWYRFSRDSASLDASSIVTGRSVVVVSSERVW